MDFLKRLKNSFSTSKYTLRKISSDGEKALKVVQELRDLSQELQSDLRCLADYKRGFRENIETPHELEIMGQVALSTIAQNSCAPFALVVIYKDYINWHPVSKKASRSIRVREEISLEYLSDVLKAYLPDTSGGLFLIVNLDDFFYHGPFEEFVWNYCGQRAITKGVVWPNMEAQRNFSGKIDASDSLHWREKADNCCFYGSDTGSISIEDNDRVQIALLAKKHNSPLFSAKITDWVRVDLSKASFDKAAITGRHVSMQDQLKSKIILSIDGNTSSWERPAWIMNSNSLLFKYESEYYDWFYDKLIDGQNYVLIKRGDDILDKIRYYIKNEELSLSIIRNAQATARESLHFPQHLVQSRVLLEEYQKRLFV